MAASSAAAAARGAKLFVARLPWTANRESLWNHFKQYGSLKDTKVIFDANTGRSKKFGFVFFKAFASAENAIQSNPHYIDGQEIAVLISDAPKRTVAETTDSVISDASKRTQEETPDSVISDAPKKTQEESPNSAFGV